ncbi:MAG: hypothetical protein WCD43_06330, partial [Candidatus Acidiferrales bacterium]
YILVAQIASSITMDVRFASKARFYPEVIFRPTQIEGQVAHSGASDLKLHGIFSIRGSDHPLVALVHVEMSPDRSKGSCTFDVPDIAWEMKNPSNFLLKMKPLNTSRWKQVDPSKWPGRSLFHRSCSHRLEYVQEPILKGVIED